MQQPQRAEASPRSRSCRVIDLLAEPCGAVGASRVDGMFTVKQPWQLADFGQFRLEHGWWRLDAETEDAIEGEVRLTSPSHPLLIYSIREARNVRLYLNSEEAFHIRLLVAAWPGEYHFSRLRLRRLSGKETAAIVLDAGRRFASSRNGARFLSIAAKQLLSGEPIGFRTALPAPAPTKPTTSLSKSETVRADFRELVAPNRYGDLVSILRPDDTLHGRAIELVQTAFTDNPNWQAVYCDVRIGSEVLPTPAWDPILAGACGFPARPTFIRASAFDSEPTAHDLPGLARRFGDASIGRIPLPLVSRTYDDPPRLEELSAPRLNKYPLVSVVIPTKYRMDLLAKCLEGLASHTDYPNLEIVIVDNGANKASLDEAIAPTASALCLKLVQSLTPFNFSQLVNLGARQARGDVLLFLNDDVVAEDATWLVRMIASIEAGAGVVGARLLYPDRSIQHAGVVMGFGGVCGHLWKGLDADAAAPNPFIIGPGRRKAVTGACLAAPRSVFDAIGGWDESLAVAFNDIDFCLRAREAGADIIYRGDAVLIHHESQSRGQDSASIAKRRRLVAEHRIFLNRWSGETTLDDPAGSPAFDPADEHGRAHRAVYQFA